MQGEPEVTSAATIDIAAVESLTDDELATALALFTAGIGRREATSAVRPPACKAALSHVSLCECRSCRGEFHGADHRASRERFAAHQARRTDYVQPGFTRSMLAAIDDDAF
jgi:hypothetical protein